MDANHNLDGWMNDQECYEWGNIFASPWDEIVTKMSARAAALGLTQDAHERAIVWKKGDETRTRFVFVDDPSDIESIRSIYNDEANMRVPMCLIVVRQPDPSDTRGDIIFDIFKLSRASYLWHFNRVYTPPKKEGG